MSTSTDAILCYGIPLDEDQVIDADGEPLLWVEDFTAWLCRSIPRARISSLNLALVTHCSGDCPRYILSIRDSKMVASRGDVVFVLKLDTRPEWENQLRIACEMLGLKQMTGNWCLVSYWG